jgi:hypothetical protein
VIVSIFKLFDGVYIFFNSIIVVLGVILTFLLGVSVFYFYKNDSIYARIKREKSNKNLSLQRNDINSNIIPEEKVLEIFENNKGEISYYYFELRNIELFDFDTSFDDFKDLISNCFKKTSMNYTFKLEVSAYEAHYFIREFLVPFLEKLNTSVIVPKKHITSLLKYKENEMYHPINYKSFSTMKRISYTDDQKNLYDSVKMT